MPRVQTIEAERLIRGVNEDFPAAMIFDRWIAAGVTISDVEVVADGGLTIENARANDSVYASLDNPGTDYAVGRVVLYDISGGNADTDYKLRFKVTLSNGWELEGIQPWTVV